MTKRVSLLLFLVAEIILFLISVMGEGPYLNVVHYSAIVICFLYSLFCIDIRGDKPFEICILLGLLFTCVADYFLVILDQYYEKGVFFFFLTQCCYCMYLSKRARMKWLTIRVASLLLIVFAFILLGWKDQMLLLFVICYGLMFAYNIAESIFEFNKHRLFTIGLILFFCCDICVGIHNIELIIPGMSIGAVAGWLMWIFYLPSQVCIALSTRK